MFKGLKGCFRVGGADRNGWSGDWKEDKVLNGGRVVEAGRDRVIIAKVLHWICLC